MQSARGGAKGGAAAILSQKYTLQCTAQAVARDEAGFASDAEKIRERIEDVKSPWADRLEAIKQLQGLILGGAAELHNFRDIMSDKLRYPIIAQIGELRSQIVKEVCTCVMLACYHSSQHLAEDLSGWFIPALQKQLPVTVLAISSAVNQAIRFLLEKGRVGPAAIKHILESCTCKNTKTRVRAFEHLFLLLHHVPLERVPGVEAEAVVARIAKGVADQDQVVRQLARLCYWGVQQRTSRGDALWGRLSDHQRKLVAEEQGLYLELAGGAQEVDQEMDGGAYPPQAQEPSTQQQPPPQQQHQGAPKRTSTPGGLQRGRSGSAVRGRVRSRSVYNSSTSSVGSVGPLTETRSVNTVAPPAPSNAPPAKKPAQRQGRVGVPRAAGSAGAGAGGASRAPLGDSPEELIEAGVGGSSPDRRADAFSGLARLVGQEASSGMVGRVMEAALQRLPAEQSPDVAHEILHCVQTAVEVHPRETAVRLEKILVAMFASMSDKRETRKRQPLHAKARDAVNTIMGCNTVTTMLQALLQVLESPTPKVKGACLECFEYILRWGSDYLETPSHMNQCIVKLLKVLIQSGGDPEIGSLVPKCLASMHEKQPSVFVSVAAGLHLQQKRDLVEATEPLLPGLRQQMRQCARTRSGSVQKAAPPPRHEEEERAHVQQQQQQQQQHQQHHHHHHQVDVQRTSHPQLNHQQHEQQYLPQTQQPAVSHYDPMQTNAVSGPQSIQLWAQGDRSDIKQAALRDLLDFHGKQRQWLQFHEIIPAVLQCLGDGDFMTRGLAVAVLRVALENMPVESAEMLGEILTGLFRALEDQQSDVSTKAKEALYDHLKSIPPARVVGAVLELAGSMTERGLQAALVGILPKALSGLTLQQHMLQPLRDLIHFSIQSETTDLRKAATWCLVDLYLGAHDIALSLSDGLPPAKIRLLDFYISKRKPEGSGQSLATDLDMLRHTSQQAHSAAMPVMGQRQGW